VGRVTVNRRDTTRMLRNLTGRADQLHPAALLALVLVLVGLIYAAAPFLVTLFTALVAALKAAAFLTGAGILARLVIRAAVTYHRTSTPTGRTA
jgi:hypothetical protein